VTTSPSSLTSLSEVQLPLRVCAWLVALLLNDTQTPLTAVLQYEQHEEKEGKPENHKFAKELLAGFVGAETDKLFETKGLDYLDRWVSLPFVPTEIILTSLHYHYREKVKHHAQQEAYQQYDQRY
jgi:hypothetical protein